MDLNQLPIVNILGDRGPERERAILQLVRMYQRRGIRVRVLPGAQGVGPQELFDSLRAVDLVLAEDLAIPSLPALYLAGGAPVLPHNGAVLATLARDVNRVAAMDEVIGKFLAGQWAKPAVVGCLLIGGKSSRMGRAKHLLRENGRSWLQRTAALLAGVTDQVVVAGQGEIEDCALPRISDAVGCSGPLSGILAAMRAFPWSTVLACACDLPDLSQESLVWLLRQRRPGRWAVIPRVSGRVEPLLALYDFRIFIAAEAMAERGVWRMATLAEAEGAHVVVPPLSLAGAWRNVNTPEQLRLGAGEKECR